MSIASSASEAEDEDQWDLFQEPDDFRPKTPPPTEVVQRLYDGTEVRLKLVGSHPLWGHHLWNAAPVMADYLQEYAERLSVGRVILELGAGAGLPSIAADRAGASRVIATDYPDPELIKTLQTNVDQNACRQTVTQGFIWGSDPSALLTLAPNHYDTILMSDLVFNHQAHNSLLDTCDTCLTRDLHRNPCILVFFTHHRPHLAEKDTNFFQLAEDRGYRCSRIREWRREVRRKLTYSADVPRRSR